MTVICIKMVLNPMLPKYGAKRRGPRAEPCGTPHERGAEEDTESPRLTQKVLSAKYDLNHSSAVPLMPTHCSM